MVITASSKPFSPQETDAMALKKHCSDNFLNFSEIIHRLISAEVARLKEQGAIRDKR